MYIIAAPSGCVILALAGGVIFGLAKLTCPLHHLNHGKLLASTTRRSAIETTYHFIQVNSRKLNINNVGFFCFSGIPFSILTLITRRHCCRHWNNTVVQQYSAVAGEAFRCASPPAPLLLSFFAVSDGCEISSL